MGYRWYHFRFQAEGALSITGFSIYFLKRTDTKALYFFNIQNRKLLNN